MTENVLLTETELCDLIFSCSFGGGFGGMGNDGFGAGVSFASL